MSLNLDRYSHTYLQNSKPPIDDFIQRLLVPVPPVEPQTRCEDVYGIFAGDPSVQSIAVVENGLPWAWSTASRWSTASPAVFSGSFTSASPFPSSWKNRPSSWKAPSVWTT